MDINSGDDLSADKYNADNPREVVFCKTKRMDRVWLKSTSQISVKTLFNDFYLVE